LCALNSITVVPTYPGIAECASRVRARGPGRVNLIGEHTDYNGGLALPFAIARGVTVAAEAMEGDRVVVEALDLAESDEFPYADPQPVRGWRAFARGMVAELRPAGAARLSIEGDLPRGAGLSSSAALSTALALALLGLGGREVDRMDLARVCSRVENEWVGSHAGLLDQLAALFSREGEALRIDFTTLELSHVPLDLGDWTLATLDSGVVHDNATSGYNERRAECARACELLGIESLRQATAAHIARLPEPLGRRVRYVLEENARVDAAVAALTRGDLLELARLLDGSHAGLRDLYEVSTPEVERAVELMKEAGAAGARLVGGGFGGAVLGLFPPGAEPPAGALVAEPAPAARLL
jgi:galactokinase